MKIDLVGLKRRLMLILFYKNNWFSVKIIQKFLCDSFRAGSCDKTYSYNRICIALRELEILKLLEKRGSSQGSWGRSQLYKINAEGIEVLKQNNLIPKIEVEKNAELVEKYI
jgi:hypothetical protein